VAEAIMPYLDRPFAFFGHSLGALLSFELARYLRKQHGLSPIHLFLSGLGAPQIPVRELARHNLPEAEFIEELHRLKGTPKEVLENPELMRLMIPMLRADFSVSATYEYKIEPPLDCPFTVLGGLQDDDVGHEMLEGWREQTLSTFSLRMLPGDHFFLHSAQALLLDILHKELHRKYAMISANQKAPARSL
jgi:medium-chain acyl-[acyl-carrier-protein] hydrolase